MKLTGFDELLSDVRSLEQELSAPASFYERNREKYHRHAHIIAVSVLLAARPPDHQEDSWRKKVEAIAERITTDLLAGGTGILFSFAPADSPTDGSRPITQRMSYQDIIDWIQAGIDGKPGGKRITAIDEKVFREKGIKGVASIVMKAYYSMRPDSNYTRLRAAIQRYFLGARAEAAAPLLEAVTIAWHEHFAIAIPRDLTNHAARLCRDF